MPEQNVILLIEDEDAHVQLIKRAFKAYGTEFELLVAKDLKSAQEELSSRRPDLIIGDLNLPDGKSLELLNPGNEANNCPMVILTGQGDEEVAVQTMKAGVLDYVVKSVAILENIPQIARRALREWQHIQKHKQALEALKHSEEKYRMIVEEASDVIFFIDPTGKILDINQSGTTVLQYSYNEMLKFSLKDLFVNDYDANDSDFHTITTDTAVIKEIYLQCQDESIIPFEISFRKLINGKIIAIGRNITLRKIQELEGKRSREELERFNRLAVGREIRMIGLKKEVNQLLLLLGQNEKYKIHNPEEIQAME